MGEVKKKRMTLSFLTGLLNLATGKYLKGKAGILKIKYCHLERRFSGRNTGSYMRKDLSMRTGIS